MKANVSLGFNVIILPEEDLMTVVSRYGRGMVGLALTIWFLAWVFVTCLNLAAARQVRLDIYFNPH